MRNLVRLALEEDVAFVLLAGDLYDGDWRDYNTGLFLAREMTRLREAGIPVFVVSGNHDAASQITRSLRLPDNVTVFPARAPRTAVLEHLGVAVHGQGFPRRAVAEDLSAGYPPPHPGLFNVGLLHTSADGRPGHAEYAPCTVQGLLARGYDYWALGHVHRREVLHRDPWIVFPGNTQGRSVREPGPKGCTLVSVVAGRVEAVEPRELDAARWATCRVDAGGAETPEEVVARVREAVADEADRCDGRLLAARVRVEGTCPAHRELQREPERWTAEVRAGVTDATWGGAWVERVELGTRGPADLEAALARDDALGDLLRYVRDLEPREVEELLAELEPLRAKLPPEALRGEGGLGWGGEAEARALLEDVRELLVSELLAVGEEP